MSREAPHEPTRARLRALVAALGLQPSPPAPCPYLPGRESRLVVVRPERLTAPLYHAFMDLNFRRLGDLVYRPECDGCRECRQLRVAVTEHRPTRSQRRCLRRNADVEIETHPPQATAEKHAVYRSYLEARHDGQMSGSWQEFQDFLHAPALFTQEVVFRVSGRLMGAGIFDVTPLALSAVYFYFDPAFARRSPGIFNVLWLLGECRRRGAAWLYLGYYVADCAVMAYKDGFHPHETLGGDGRWR